MSLFKRIETIVFSLIAIVLSLYMVVDTDRGCMIFLTILSLGMMLFGLKQIIYFLSMGIHMVGGKLILYKGLIVLDFGVVLWSVNTVAPQYVMIYLLCFYIFTAAINMMRAMEMRRLKASWKLQMATAVLNLINAIRCILFFGLAEYMLSALCLGFIYSAFMRIVMACRKTAVVYIQ